MCWHSHAKEANFWFLFLRLFPCDWIMKRIIPYELKQLSTYILCCCGTKLLMSKEMILISTVMTSFIWRCKKHLISLNKIILFRKFGFWTAMVMRSAANITCVIFFCRQHSLEKKLDNLHSFSDCQREYCSNVTTDAIFWTEFLLLLQAFSAI